MRTAADVIEDVSRLESDCRELTRIGAPIGKAKLDELRIRKARLEHEFRACLELAALQGFGGFTHKGETHFSPQAPAKADEPIRFKTLPACSVVSPFSPVPVAQLMPAKAAKKSASKSAEKAPPKSPAKPKPKPRPKPAPAAA